MPSPAAGGPRATVWHWLTFGECSEGWHGLILRHAWQALCRKRRVDTRLEPQSFRDWGGGGFILSSLMCALTLSPGMGKSTPCMLRSIVPSLGGRLGPRPPFSLPAKHGEKGMAPATQGTRSPWHLSLWPYPRLHLSSQKDGVFEHAQSAGSVSGQKSLDFQAGIRLGGGGALHASLQSRPQRIMETLHQACRVGFGLGVCCCS